jgi:hypothetical protein
MERHEHMEDSDPGMKPMRQGGGMGHGRAIARRE